ncbi:MAG TPA: hypothetical protein VF634_12345 [Pyrinomonadaceae bacterium]
MKEAVGQHDEEGIKPMTGEELERAIEFLLQSQANHEARLGELTERIGELTEKTHQLTQQVTETGRQVTETGRQVAETGQQLTVYAETQSVFIQTVTRALEAQDQINASLRAADARTDERLNKLIGLFEQHITTGH